MGILLYITNYPSATSADLFRILIYLEPKCFTQKYVQPFYDQIAEKNLYSQTFLYRNKEEALPN